MNSTLKIVIITVFATLASLAVVGAVAAPHVVEKIKNEAVVNYGDEYEELAFLLDESKDPVLQVNYIITGLIMSPDFQEYLDQGVQNGWWTEEYLEQFLIDEALPIFFTNYHVLFSAILGSDQVQGAGEKLTIIASKVRSIVGAVIQKVGVLSNLINNNSDKIASIKNLVATLQANKDSLVAAVEFLKGLNIEGLHDAIANLDDVIAQLQTVIDAIKNIDKDNVDSLIASIDSVIATLNSLDLDNIKATIASLEDLVEKAKSVDKKKVQETIDQLKAVIAAYENLDKDKIVDTLKKVSDLVEAVQNGEIDGLLGEVLANILESDAIQDILGNLDATVDNIIKFINIYITKFIDYDYDANWYHEQTVLGKTIDLSDYALVLNVIDVLIPSDGYVYDNNGTPAKLGDDTLTISKAYVGFEIDPDPTTNVLSEPIVIEGAQASAINTFIPTLNSMI